MQEQNLHNFDEKLNYLERCVLSQDEYCDEEKKEVKHKLSYLKSQLKKKWTEAHKKSQLSFKRMISGYKKHSKYRGLNGVFLVDQQSHFWNQVKGANAEKHRMYAVLLIKNC